MSHRIAISIAAAAMGISCIATDASARGGFGFGGGHAVGPVGGFHMTTSSNFRAGASSFANVAARPSIFRTGVNRTANGSPSKKYRPYSLGFAGGGAGTPALRVGPAGGGAGTPPAGSAAGGGGGVAMGSSYYVPASYSAEPGDTVCGHYPYPPCRKKHTKPTD
jgi:hypothetical protein